MVDQTAQRSGVRDAILWIGIGALVYLALYPWFFAAKQLSHDDIALFMTARDEDLRYWLSRGYSDFFELAQYPFIRPVSHGVMRLGQIAFGGAFGLYFLPFFLMLGLGSWAALRLAAALELPRTALWALAPVLLLQPAWIAPGLLFITFQQDALAGIWCMLAALACWQRRWLVAAALLLLAVFTKEIALFAPIAAALWALLWVRSWRGAAVMIAPLVIWAVLRSLMIGSVSGGTYVTTGGGLVSGLLRGLAIWPTGFMTPADIKGLLAAIGRDGLAGLAAAPWVAASLLLNLLIDLLIAVAALAAAVRLWRGGRAPVAQAEGLVLIWTLGAFGLVALVAYDLRFAAALHPVLILLLARLAAAPPWWPALLRPLALGTLLLFVAGLAVQLAVQVQGRAHDSEPALFAALTQAVAAQPAAPDERILVLNAPISGPAPKWDMGYWNRPGTMIFANRAHGCQRASGVPAPQVTALADGRVRITLAVPDCARILVLWADDKPAVAEAGARRPLGEDAAFSVRFPEARVERGAAAGSSPDVDFGRQVVAELRPGDVSRVLVRDWATGGFVPLDLAAGSTGRHDGR